jgi:septal ring factor EnvC (AmiA/AmiB activator)
MLTENANRTRDEVIIHVDKRFAEHETKAFERLDSQDKAAAETAKRVDEFEKQLAELRAELKALADSLRKREP